MSPTLMILCSVIGLTSGVGVLPDSENKAVGDTVTFTPSLDPTDTQFLSITWRFGEVTIITVAATNITNEQYKDRITLFFSTGSLELRNLALSDSGDYSVALITAGGEPKDGTTTLNIYERVSNVKVAATSTDLVEFNDIVTLSCSASGSPQSFLWFNGNTEVKPSDRVRFTDGGATVTIDPVLRYDQGSYTCRAFNPVSNDISGPVSLSVSYGPEGVDLTAPPSDVYTEGSIVPLSCSADSRPEAQFRWLLNGEMFDTGAQINLEIKQSGNYSCQAFNSKTQRYTTSQPVELTVFRKIENCTVKPSSPPIEGLSVNLTCDTSGSIPTREWMLNGIYIKPSENIQFYDEKRILSFTNLTRKDNGKYTCIISNPVSSQTVDYIMKAIYGPENVKISGPMEIEEKETLTLSCSADSEPTAKYTWTKNGATLAQTSDYTKHKISSSDSGEYICRATNEITTKSCEASHAVNVTESPEKGLSTGAIAGITVASLVVVAGAAAGGFYLYQHKKARKEMNNGRELVHVYENTSNTGNFKTDKENKNVYENSHNEYDRNL